MTTAADAAKSTRRARKRGGGPQTIQTARGEFEILIERRPHGLIRRWFATQRHFLGLTFGGLSAFVAIRKRQGRAGGFGMAALRLVSGTARLFLMRALRDLPFPVQLRRRLEILGPTYIKLGQVLSLREDILPRAITEELKNLLSQLPIVRYPRYLELIEQGLGRPAREMFAYIDEAPIGSASIAQTHLATTVEGDKVVLKVVKPGIKKTLQTDSKLILMLGSLLQIVIPQFQPKSVMREFTDYTLREVDLRLEAENAETFAANFKDQPDVRFPKIYRRYTSESVLCMEFFDGMRPDSEAAKVLTEAEKSRLLELGAASIIRMLYKDGFFHADLHPGNLLILERRKCGFIDLGMIGRFDDGLRRTLLYYYYCLVTGDAENAARYLASAARPAKGSRPDAFRRHVEDVSRRWRRMANFDEFSLAQLILESVSMGGKYRMYFPMEMVLMVKALITFEGVGQLLTPGFDVAQVSQRQISKLFFGQFNPVNLVKESLRGAPEVVDALVKAPLLVTQGLRYLEQASKGPSDNPLSGIRGTMFAGFCLIAGALLLTFKTEDWHFSLPFFLIAAFLALRRGR